MAIGIYNHAAVNKDGGANRSRELVERGHAGRERGNAKLIVTNGDARENAEGNSACKAVDHAILLQLVFSRNSENRTGDGGCAADKNCFARIGQVRWR